MTNQRCSTSEPYEHEGYSPGHPWYYFLGGKPLMPRQILEATRASGYEGYAREEIKAADRLPEPKRSQKLRALRKRFEADLWRDISRYRECVRKLNNGDWLALDRDKVMVCNDIHTALSLKHNHLVNNFAHLIMLDELLTKQMDLFDF